MQRVGKMLRAAREARGMAIVDVAQITRIPRASVRAIEEGDRSRLPAEVFVRGFVRAYAIAVGLSAQDLLCELTAPSCDDPALAPERRPADRGGASNSARAFTDRLALHRARPRQTGGRGFRSAHAILLVLAVGMFFAAWLIVGTRSSRTPETASPGPPSIQQRVRGVSAYTDAKPTLRRHR